MTNGHAGVTGPYGTILGIAKTLVAGGPLELTLQRIVDDFPKSAYKVLAEKELARVGTSSTPAPPATPAPATPKKPG